jgi:hypothetical protein
MNTAAHPFYAHSAASNVANAVALNLAQTAHLTTLDAWSAPYRSESFAEDLPNAQLPAEVPSRLGWRLRLLLAVPLGLALIGSMLPVMLTPV